MRKRGPPVAWIIVGCFFFVALLSRAGSGLKPFTAEYDLSRSGIVLATVKVSLRLSPAERYHYQARTIPTGPVAVFRDDEIIERSEGRISGTEIHPESYIYHHLNPKKSRRVNLDFDWQAGQVTNHSDGSQWTMAIHPGTQDKFSQQLRLMLIAGKEFKQIEFPVADGGRLKQYRFQAQGWEQVSTEAGTFKALKLARSKNNKPSQASYWLAPELNQLPVKVEKAEPEGNFVMRLRSLTWH